jgi:hypothetical protein
VLANQFAADRGFAFSGSLTSRVAPLDPILTTASLRRSSGSVFGVRLARRMTPRVSAVFGFDISSVRWQFTDTALTGIESSRATFVQVFSGILATGGPTFANPSVTAATTFSGGARSLHKTVTGALEIDLAGAGPLTPYVTAGAGVSTGSIDLPVARVSGNYQFMFSGVARIDQTDVATVHFEAPDTRLVAVFGGGVRYAVSGSHGLRIGARVEVSGHAVDTLVDAAPVVASAAPAIITLSTTNPAIAFSNSPLSPGNLSGAPIADLKTFTGSGVALRVGFTAGYFFRF